jgi:putative tryptophan/tyrosine transport system substrate-binding protein
MRRRDFVRVIVGSATAWPLTLRAQQNKPKAMRRVAVLLTYSANDPVAQNRNAAFLQGLQQLGWTVGQNVQIDYRWSAGSEDDARKYAAELVALAPDVILVNGAAVEPLQRATRTVPIVFVIVPDPVGNGFVASLAHPGGNITGFTPWDYGIGAKWLALLKEIAPNTTRAAVLRDPTIRAGMGQWGAILSVSPSVAIEVSPISLGDADEMDSALSAFARSPNGGLIVTGSALTALHRDLIIALAARHRLPAIYYERDFVSAGGLISYGTDYVEQFRLVAAYVDRILKGEKPADLPVQTPTKYETVINLKTAKALGLTIPPTLLARARFQSVMSAFEPKRHHAGSLRLNVCEFDYLCPFLGFVSDELAECDRRHRHRFDAEGEKAPLQIGIADAGDNLSAELVDDRSSSAHRHAYAVPATCLIAGDKFADSGNVRQQVRTFGGGDR